MRCIRNTKEKILKWQWSLKTNQPSQFNILQLISLTSMVNNFYSLRTNTAQRILSRRRRISLVQTASNTSKLFLLFMVYQNAFIQTMPRVLCQMIFTINVHHIHLKIPSIKLFHWTSGQILKNSMQKAKTWTIKWLFYA